MNPMTVSSPTAPSFRRARRSGIYVGLAVLCALIAVAGFGPGSLDRVIHGDLASPWIVHLHAAVYSVWLLLFILQGILIYRQRADLHQKVGWCMAAYAGLVFAVGVGVTINRFVTQVHEGHVLQAERINLAPAVDMLLFPIFFISAILLRKRADYHKRLMVVATTGLLFAAVARMAWLSALGGYAAFVTVWLSPVWLGMAYDLIALRLIHPAYAAGLTLLLVSALRYYAVDSIWWHDIAERLVRLVS